MPRAVKMVHAQSSVNDLRWLAPDELPSALSGSFRVVTLVSTPTRTYRASPISTSPHCFTSDTPSEEPVVAGDQYRDEPTGIPRSSRVFIMASA
eukprot:CAMPEP_0170178904 /NCGR_PEP_ID=MMETSP0040_2-20121228/14911_1 /TAXON_ID=641309 /ORGANISM="Lotharella oceanica, Strain CCMP622" /LENGTH=93 /DNA_ID=CAMNT_0010422535 /DNA_START=248 /DNA_END=529 /DNA_ORIENTATION=+